MANRLKGSTSPYLLQHADNPVDWREWGEEAFAEARARDVPVLLSVGYAACHWCHVMAHESFEDEATAAQMNAELRVREGRPRGAARRRQRVHDRDPGADRAGRLADDRVRHARGQAVLLRHVLPAGAAARHARLPPGALRRLRCVEHPPAGARGGGRADRHRHRGPAGPGRARPAVGRAARRAPSRRSRRRYDERCGGFGGAPKFPPSMVLRVPAAPRRPHGRRAGAGHGPGHARGDGPRRHLRPARRRLRALLRRRAVGGAALREDALRQRAAPARLPAPLAGDRRRSGRGGSPTRRRSSWCATSARPRAASPPRSTPTPTASRG